jgi:undecaprenyl diphosphate synthase
MLNSLNHVAIIMDGNRRWAKQRLLSPYSGHKNGVVNIKDIILLALSNNIKMLSLYSFSIENLKRSKSEIDNIFKIIIDYANSSLDFLLENNIQVNFLGDRSLFPDFLKDKIYKLEEDTSHFDKLVVNLLFFYGGKQEIFHAVKNIANDIYNNRLNIDNLDLSTFESYLWTFKAPSPDLIIRTGGFKRLSNFMLYQAAYSEIYFTDILWPDFGSKEFQNAIDDFYKRERKFGY